MYIYIYIHTIDTYMISGERLNMGHGVAILSGTIMMNHGPWSGSFQARAPTEAFSQVKWGYDFNHIL